jgi:hypothetical protein
MRRLARRPAILLAIEGTVQLHSKSYVVTLQRGAFGLGGRRRRPVRLSPRNRPGCSGDRRHLTARKACAGRPLTSATRVARVARSSDPRSYRRVRFFDGIAHSSFRFFTSPFGIVDTPPFYKSSIFV